MHYFIEPNKALKDEINTLYNLCKDAYSVDNAFEKVKQLDLATFEIKAREYLEFSQSIYVTYYEELNTLLDDEHAKFFEYMTKLNYIYSRLFNCKIRNTYNLTTDFINYIRWNEDLESKNVPLITIRENSGHKVQLVNSNGEEVLTDKASNIYKKLTANDFSIKENSTEFINFVNSEGTYAFKLFESIIYRIMKDLGDVFDKETLNTCVITDEYAVMNIEHYNKLNLSYMMENSVRDITFRGIEGEEFSVKESFIYELLFAYTKIIAGDFSYKTFADCKISDLNEASDTSTDIKPDGGRMFRLFSRGVEKGEFSEADVYRYLNAIHKVTDDSTVDVEEVDEVYIVHNDTYNDMKDAEEKLDGIDDKLKDIEDDLAELERSASSVTETIVELRRDL